ncbi:MAG: flagellin [Campylobacterota bacterium]|nr:flagellin [Campylobacterota bacterium]
MRINTNVASLTAQESATNTNKTLSSSLEKLSSGLRINKASDDASGLAIADKLRTQASSIGQAISNGNSAVSLTQIADKAMAEQSNILDIVKQKLIQASTATTSAEGRDAIGKDINKLLTQIDNIAQQTNYNGIQLLQASAGSKASAGAQVFQMGEKSADTITLGSGITANTSGLSGMSVLKASSLGGGSAFSAGVARGYMAHVDSALNQLNSWRADVGSTQNQLESALRNMMTQQTNIKAAESVIRDVDYAAESANFNKANIIAQAGTYAMSQANAMQQNVQRLLQ